MTRLYDRSFALVFLCQVSFVLANVMMAHYARWIEWLGGSVREVGWIMGAGSIAGLVLRPWMGQWINRLGARRTWALGLLIFSTATLGNLLVRDLGWELYLLRSGLVLGAAFVFASSLTYISQLAPPGRRTEAIGTLGAAGFVGMLAGPYLGDIILGGMTRTRGDFTLLFLTATAVLPLSAMLLLFVRTPISKDRTGPTRLGDFVHTIRLHWPGTILLVTLLFGVCMSIPFGFLASYIDEVGLVIPGGSAIGVFFLGYAGWGITVRLGLRRVPDRIGRRRVLLAGMVIMALGMFSFVLVDPREGWWILMPGIICGNGHALMFHTMTSLALDPFPHEVRGTGSALALMMLDSGMILGAPILGQIAQAYGFDWLFITVGAACLLVASIYTCSSIPVWVERSRHRRARSFPEVTAASGSLPSGVAGDGGAPACSRPETPGA